ncbi:hypothetical protein HBH53_109410 [Parastagonospora nodorum]|nr:hypothetical protein HBH53_109410 [Parastagonospora nodorum]KAH5113935.1 hypothetical protein HBH71_152450 [Parastagonospora nodorum]
MASLKMWAWMGFSSMALVMSRLNGCFLHVDRVKLDSCTCTDEFILFCMVVAAIAVVGLMFLWWGFFGI